MSAAKPTTVREWLEANVSGDAETIATEIGDDFKKVRDRLYWMRSQGQAERNDFGAWQLTASASKGKNVVQKSERPAAKRGARRQPVVAVDLPAPAVRLAGGEIADYEVVIAKNGDFVVLLGDRVNARVPAAIAAAIRAAA